MPHITGKLTTITQTPSQVKEVWVRPTHTRTGDTGLIVDEPVRVLVDGSGNFQVSLAPGRALLVLVGADFMARESVELLVHEATATIRQAVEDAKDFPAVSDETLADMVAQIRADVERLSRYQHEADQAGQRLHGVVEQVKDAASRVVRDAVEKAKAETKNLGVDLSQLVGRAEKAQTAAAQAASSAATAHTQANQAVSAATTAKNGAENALREVREKLDSFAPYVPQLEKWQPQYQWLKDNAASGFARIAELTRDAAASVRSELSGLVEQAKTAQSEAGQHSLKAQAAAQKAESMMQQAVDEAVRKITDGAPEAYDTLRELAERVKTGGTLESSLVGMISLLPSSKDFDALKKRVEGLNIAGVSGLSQALKNKADKNALSDLGRAFHDSLTQSEHDLRESIDEVRQATYQTIKGEGQVVGIKVVSEAPQDYQPGYLYLVTE